MAITLDGIFFNGVRGLISPDVTAAQISDAYLQQQPFGPDAKRTVTQQLQTQHVDVDSLTGEAADTALLAMMHACAAVLCLTAPQLIRQTQLQVMTELQNIDWKEKRMFHLDEVKEKIREVVAVVRPPATTSTTKTRRNPFGAVGTARGEIGNQHRTYRG